MIDETVYETREKACAAAEELAQRYADERGTTVAVAAEWVGDGFLLSFRSPTGIGVPMVVPTGVEQSAFLAIAQNQVSAQHYLTAMTVALEQAEEAGLLPASEQVANLKHEIEMAGAGPAAPGWRSLGVFVAFPRGAES